MGVASSIGIHKRQKKQLFCGCCEGKDDFELTIIEAAIKKPIIPRVIYRIAPTRQHNKSKR